MAGRLEVPWIHWRIAVWVPDCRAQANPLDVVTTESDNPFDHAHQMRPAVGAGQRMDLVHDHAAQVPKQQRRVHATREKHHLERLRRGHQQLGGILQELAPFVVGHVAVPQESTDSDHLGVQPQTAILIVEQGPERRHVDGTDAIGRGIDHRGDQRKQGRLGLAASRWRQDHGVVSVQQCRAGRLLDRPQAAPSQTRYDGLLKQGSQPRKHTHQTSSLGTSASSASSIGGATPESACFSSGLSSAGVKLYAAIGS